MTELTPQQQVERHREFLEKLGKRRQLILDQWSELRSIRWSGTGLDQMRIWVQQVATGCAVFGHQELGDRARELENRLACIPRDGPRPEGLIATISSSVERLRLQLDRALAEASKPLAVPEAAPEAASAHPLVFVVDADADCRDLLAALLSVRGYRVKAYADTASMMLDLDLDPPSAILLEVAYPDDEWGGIDAIKGLRLSSDFRTPVLFVSARGDLDARLSARRVGAAAFLTKPLDLGNLHSTLRLACRNAWRESLRVLVIDDDEASSTHYYNVIQAAGMTASVLRDPAQTLKAIPRIRPDVVLVNLQQPGLSGDELLAVLSEVPEYAGLPVVCLAESSRGASRGLGPANPVHLHLAKTGPQELTDTLRRSVLESERWLVHLRSAAPTAAGTVALSAERFKSRLDRVLRRANGDAPPAGLAYLAVDQLAPLHAAPGLSAVLAVQRAIESAVAAVVGSEDGWSVLGTAVIGILLAPRSTAEQAEFMRALGEAVAAQELANVAQTPGVSASAALLPLTLSDVSAEYVLAHTQQAVRAAGRDGGGQFLILDPQQLGIPCPTAASVSSGLPEAQLALHLQPVVDDQREEKGLFDVLVRMRGDNGELLPASDFLPQIEASGRSRQLDLWVMKAAVEHLNSAAKQGKRMELSVRLSRASVEDPGLLAAIGSTIKAITAGSGSRLVFQIEESWLGANHAAGVDFMVALRELGCGVMLCNFGDTVHPLRAAWASWVDYAKLSQHRLPDVTAKTERRPALQRMIKDAQERGARVIACQIEDELTMTTLCGWGVRLFQGRLVQM